MKISKKPRIPKKIHQIWLGGPLPERFKKWQETWLKHHPDWQYKLWTDDDVGSFKMKNKQYFDQAKNYGEKSDIWRYEILERYGGLYIDVDVECYQPCDILHHLYDFYAGIDNSLDVGVFYSNNAIIGIRARHPIVKELVKRLPEQYAQHHLDTIEKTGPHFFTDVILKKAASPSYKNIILPVTYFSPMEILSRGEDCNTWYASSVEAHKESQKWRKPESFALHHVTSSWCS